MMKLLKCIESDVFDLEFKIWCDGCDDWVDKAIQSDIHTANCLCGNRIIIFKENNEVNYMENTDEK